MTKKDDRPPIKEALDDTEWLRLEEDASGDPVRVHPSAVAAFASLVGGGGNPGLEIVLQNGGNPLIAGIEGVLDVQSNCTINSVLMTTDQVGSISVDIWKCTFAQYNATTHPAIGDSICAATPPTIVAGTKYLDQTLSGWTISLTKGDQLKFHILSASTITQATVSLRFIGTPGNDETGVVAGDYTNLNATIDAQGRIIHASNGTGGTGSGSPGLLVESGPEKKISELTPAVSAQNTDAIPATRAGNNILLTAAMIAALASGGAGGSLPNASAINQVLVPTNTSGGSAWVNDRVNLLNPAFGTVISGQARAVMQAGIDYLFSIGFYEAYWPNGAGGGFNIDGPVYLDPPNNLRSGISLANQKLAVFASPSVFSKGIHLTCAPQTIISMNDGAVNWQTASAFVIGTQNLNRIFNAMVKGPSQNLGIGNRQLDPRCTAFLVASGSGGSTDTILENCQSVFTYRGMSCGQNGPSPLAEHVRCNNCQFIANIAIDIINDQALVIQVFNGAMGGDLVTFWSRTGQDIDVYGGEHGGSATSQSTTSTGVTFSTLTAFTDTLPGNQTFTNFRFDAINAGSAALADGTFFYNVSLINLPGFGQVPCRQTVWSPGTSTGTFVLDQGWVWQNYASGGVNLKTDTDFDNELVALTSMLRCQRSTIARGNVQLGGRLHIEGNQCWALYEGVTSAQTNARLVVNNIDTNNWKPGGGSDGNITLVNRHHPWIKGTGGDIILNNWLCQPDGESNGPPVVIQFAEISDNQMYTQWIANDCSWLANLNMRYVGKTDHGPPPQNGPSYDTSLSSQAMIGSNSFGFGRWSRSVWSRKDVNTLTIGQMTGRSGTGMTEFWGVLPANSQHQRITQTDYANLMAGSTNAPQVAGGKMLSVAQIGNHEVSTCVDWGGAGYSLWADQSVAWTMKGQTNCLNISGGTLTQFFNGCEIGIQPDDLSLPLDWFIVSACHYNDSGTSGFLLLHRENTSGVLNGTKTVVYSGSTIRMRKPVMASPGSNRMAFNAAAFTKTDQSLTDITGMAKLICKNMSYGFKVTLPTTSDIAGGVKVALSNLGGAATVANLVAEVVIMNGAAVAAQGRLTSLGASVGVTPVTTAYVTIEGTFQCTASGSLSVQIARNAASGTTTVLQSGFLNIWDLPLTPVHG